jgi:hypothetical protein
VSDGAPVDERNAIDVLEELLCGIAGGGTPNRSQANTYSNCRSDLLQSRAKALLPGFLYQCLTVFKFREFINLYDPDPSLRQAFVRRAMERCRAMLGANTSAAAVEPARARPADPSDPQQWMR